MDELLGELEGGDAASLVKTIERAASTLGNLDAVDARAYALARAVARHRTHERAKVREAVAEASVNFPSTVFEEVIASLRDDPSQYVRGAARRSLNERSVRRRMVRAQEEASSDLRALRARIADDYRPAAARLADRYKDLAVGQFVDRLQHELVKVGTPLRILLDGMGAEAQKPASDRLSGQIAEARATLNVLLDIAESARVHAAVVTPTFREESLRAIVDEQVSLLRARAGERAGRLVVEVAVDPAIGLEIDRALYTQAVSNILQNAVEAYRDTHAGELSVRVRGEAREGGTLIALVVEDRGRGILADQMEYLGQPFMSTKGRGRGLGMLNVKKNVETVHGGTVELESEWGKGTRVSLVVPRKQRV